MDYKIAFVCLVPKTIFSILIKIQLLNVKNIVEKAVCNRSKFNVTMEMN
jgi:hypothetical protein